LVTREFGYSFITFLLALLLKYGEILQHSDITVLFVFFACFSASTICQCFLFSVFFNKANIASVLAGIFFYILYLPYTILINYQDVLVTWHMILASLSSTVAFSYGCDIIATFELQNQRILLILLHYGRKSNDYWWANRFLLKKQKIKTWTFGSIKIDY